MIIRRQHQQNWSRLGNSLLVNKQWTLIHGPIIKTSLCPVGSVGLLLTPGAADDLRSRDEVLSLKKSAFANSYPVFIKATAQNQTSSKSTKRARIIWDEIKQGGIDWEKSPKLLLHLGSCLWFLICTVIEVPAPRKHSGKRLRLRGRRERKKKADITFHRLMNIQEVGGVAEAVRCYLCECVCGWEREYIK